jgi:hypothetical protein
MYVVAPIPLGASPVEHLLLENIRINIIAHLARKGNFMWRPSLSGDFKGE